MVLPARGDAMPRSASVSAVPRRVLSATSKRTTPSSNTSSSSSDHPQQDRRNSLEHLDPLKYPATPREYDSWPCDSFFLLPDSVLGMDAGSFRADLTALDPALSASLPDWGRPNSPSYSSSYRRSNHERSGVTLLHSHQGLTVTSAGHGTILIGGGGGSGDGGRVSSSSGSGGGVAAAAYLTAPTSNGEGNTTDSTPPPASADNTSNHIKREPVQKGLHQSHVVFEYGCGVEERFLTTQRADQRQMAGFHLLGPSAHFFTPADATNLTLRQETMTNATTIPDSDDLFDIIGHLSPPRIASSSSLLSTIREGERSSGVSHRDREERLRQLREKQQLDRQQKLEELKEHAAAAQRFREQQEAQRRLRLLELRSRDLDRRSQVEERRRYMEASEQQRREASFKKNVEREQRLETKRRNERSNIVFAFGSSTPRMLDPKETISYWASRRATSISNVTMGADSAGSSGNRRSSDCVDSGGVSGAGAPDLARKRATSAQGLDRNPNDLRMSSSMYEVFHWTDSPSSGRSPLTPQGGDDPLGRSVSSSVARRRTDLHPITPSLRDANGKPRHRSPGRAVSMSRLDQLAKPRQYPSPPQLLAPLHEKNSGSSSQRMSPSSPHSRTRSMTHLAGGRGGSTASPRTATASDSSAAEKLNRPLSRSTAALGRSTRAEHLRQQSRLISGVRSGGVTPSSRPTSALSQASSSATAGAVAMRVRATPRKPRPMSIAGSAPSTADRPRSPAAAREGRTAIRNTSSGSISSVKSNRAKSAGGSDSSAPSTPARTPASTVSADKPRTPKRTPQQVKAESNAKKAEKAKAAPSAAAITKRPTPKTTPAASPSVESKPLAAADEKVPKKTVLADKSKQTQAEKTRDSQPKTKDSTQNQNGSVEITPKEINTTEVAAVDAEATFKATDSKTVVENGVETTIITETQTVVADAIEPQVTEQIITTTELITETVSGGETVSTKTVVTETVTSDGETVVKETVTGGESSVPDTVTAGEATVTEAVSITENIVAEAANENEEAVVKENEEAVVKETTTTTVTEVYSNGSATGVEEIATSQTADVADTLSPAENGADEASVTAAPANGVEGAQLSDKPAAGYATEEEYKAVLAEKRRLAREAREREQELERQREEEEAERERREEQDMLRLMEEQRLAEEERLQRAIEQADREREEEQMRKEEEEKLRIEAERLDAERQKETEEKLRKEEEERQSRKSRVAAIMARTRSRGGSTTPNKADSKTPSDDNKTINEVLLKANLTDSMIDKMSDSMIAAATSQETDSDSCRASSGVGSELGSEFSSQPASDISQQPNSDVSSQGTIENATDGYTSGASSLEQTVRHEDSKPAVTLDLLGAAVQEHTNGNVPVPMDTTPTHAMDLIGSLNGHTTNGVTNSNGQQHPSMDLLGSFDPFTPSGDAPSPDPSTTVITTSASDFEQIIDASQTKLSNEDAINSNTPSAPFIAFEQNLNKKTPPESNTSVPDILL